MNEALVDWDDESDEDGNTTHVAEHGLTPQEVESVLLDSTAKRDTSDSSGRPIAFGMTHTGRYIVVVYEVLNAEDPLIVRPVTAYEVGER